MVSTHSRGVVLVVEEYCLIRITVADLFSEEGFEVLEADCVSEAIEHLDNVPLLSLLLTDLHLGGWMHGVEVANYARQWHPDCAIAVSSSGELPANCDLPDGTLLLSKPSTPRALLRQIVSRPH